MDNEQQVFGCSLDALRRGTEEQIQLLGVEMLATSILSDAQEMLDRNMITESNQFINRAKWLLSQKMKRKREAEFARYEAMSVKETL